ncbi:DUF2812 domain-containing protein [Sutcliffiella deserti]|uniref:DUF2812 domain-containing protein n=1 Tax=Sutcliffiella deserti TaxID=2875501 RepID=UPI001CC0B3B4|nr:DUF2812 domain-containing protein [Sutcliffiella deserti]
MRETKYVISGGLAFDEEKDMVKLERLARKGWIFDRFAFMGYKMKKGQSQELQYSLDYRKDADSDYFAFFEEAGWTHMGSLANYIHLYSASPGTAPIYTDKDSVVEKYENEKKVMGKGALVMVVVTFLIMAVSFLISHFSLFTGFEGTVKIVETVLLSLSLIGLVFTGLPYLGYVYRVNKLQKNRH